ncbi:hypothetical protein LOZ36_006128 [Ophidiomyces ophidiicola]|nr:hypothetical protein LOZ36_006128 [Ophidiomyces ophidiicola]
MPAWLARRLDADVALQHADVVFVLCYLLSGLCDSSVFRAWGCFVSMQTGNTVFLGLGASDAALRKSSKWLKALVSIAAFIAGSCLFALTRWLGPQRRRTLAGSFAVQAVFLAVAAVLLRTGAISGDTHSTTTSSTILVVDDGAPDRAVFLQLVPIALVAFQSAGQMAASRLLGFSEIPTTVLTSLYYDLAADPALLAPLRENVKRNRRFAAAVAVVAGAVLGGWLARATGGIETALWMAAATKFAVAVAWLCWPASSKTPPALSG